MRILSLFGSVNVLDVGTASIAKSQCLRQTSTRHGDVLRKFLTASDYARLVVRSQPHGRAYTSSLPRNRLRNNAILCLARSALSTGGAVSTGLAGGGFSGAACGIGML
jgi:hypothetical protein